MNMKLLAGLAVAITLASAMAFVGLSTKARNSPPQAAAPPSAPMEEPAAQPSASETATSGEVVIRSSVKAGGDLIKTSVNVTP